MSEGQEKGIREIPGEKGNEKDGEVSLSETVGTFLFDSLYAMSQRETSLLSYLPDLAFQIEPSFTAHGKAIGSARQLQADIVFLEGGAGLGIHDFTGSIQE